MIVSPNELRKETVQTLQEVNAVIDAVKQEASARRILPQNLVDHHGNWVLPPLLLAKTQCLATLVLLNEKKR